MLNEVNDMPTETVEVAFPGGKRVDARIGDFHIHTDQAVKAGGEAAAPQPFDLFLASIATCAGIFALNFCQARNLETQGLGVRLDCDFDEQRKLFTQMRLLVSLPEGFPDRYREGIIRAVELCPVKRHINESPNFTVELD